MARIPTHARATPPTPPASPSNAFGQQLTYETGAARADGHAHGELTTAALGLGEPEARDIGTSDEENKTDSTHEDQDLLAHAAGDYVVHRADDDAPTLVAIGEGPGEAGVDGFDIGARLLEGDTGLEMADDAEVTAGAEDLLGKEPEGLPEVDVVVEVEESGRAEARRHDADDEVGCAIEREL